MINTILGLNTMVFSVLLWLALNDINTTAGTVRVAIFAAVLICANIAGLVLVNHISK